MAHDITKTDKVAIVRDRGWHNLGQALPDNITADEALKLTMNWEVIEYPLYSVLEQDGETVRVPIESHKLLVRSDTGEQLAVVGAGYEVFQNKDMVEFIDNTLGGDFASVDTCGTLRGGRRIWFLLDQGLHDVAGVDPVGRYALFANGHDGTLAMRVLTTQVRVVCNNTLTASGVNTSKGFTFKAGEGISIRHTKNMRNAIDAARKALTTIEREHEKMKEAQNLLASVKVDSAWLQAFFMRAYEKAMGSLPTPIKKGMSPEEIQKAERTHRRCEKVVAQWLANLEDHDGGHAPEKIRDTAWEAFNAITRWADHARTVRGESDDPGRRIDTNLFGTSAKVKRDVFEVAMAMA